MLRFARARGVIIGAAEANCESILLGRTRTVAGQIGKLPELPVGAAADPVVGLTPLHVQEKQFVPEVTAQGRIVLFFPVLIRYQLDVAEVREPAFN